MLTENDILADLHTHTLASVHAFSTIKENMDVAKARGLEYIAITDHFYGELRGEQEFDQEKSRLKALRNFADAEVKLPGNLSYIPDSLHVKVKVIPGAELNFFHDYNYPWIKALGFRPIGFHDWFFEGEPFESFERFERMSMLMANDWSLVDTYAHPERGIHKLFYQEDDKYTYLEYLVNRAKKGGKPLEVNESSLANFGLEKYVEYWLKLAKENDCMLTLGSDAHICFSVGDFTNALRILNKFDYPKELILNCDRNFLERKFL